ncbi:tRNA (adenosine(37)-N6)-threonylcarbamoyltransferase complex dimerization subunit type 1 TsaB [Vibrio gallicus]|uniref:tRNA (adenosine(37)-N6)-threonylcarbamoyltransferase complex dimerization subunit type 1 TsaB n=1 Tax=Vibrio gallicus TaxID=190897 RepID=UPI0021C4B3C3|nr:tRNA (adenosine(37)-N6)-threonylcarbamoyltransferase complex dimerization subunit type 1 TsaB [Vibrio gallicus]
MSAKILALDTSTEFCSAALWVDGELFYRGEVSPRGHTTKILPMVDEILAEAGLSLKQLDGLAYGQGPGSFTGVRIGIGVAQGLAFGADLPMLGVSTLKAMAQGVHRTLGSNNVVAAIDARMSEIYWGRYSKDTTGRWIEVDEECVIPPLELVEQTKADDKAWMQAGTGWEAYKDGLEGLALSTTESGVLYPESQDIVTIAVQEWDSAPLVSAEEAAPVYLRDKVAWKKLPGRE